MRTTMGRNRGVARHAAAEETRLKQAERAAEEMRLKQAAKKVRVGVQLSGAAGGDAAAGNERGRRRGRRRNQQESMQVQDADDGSEQVSAKVSKLTAAVKSASTFYAASPRVSGSSEGGDGEEGAANDDELNEDLEGDLDFVERPLPPLDFDYVGCVNYVIFLLLYTMLALEGRNKSTFQFGQFARDAGAVGEFMQIDSVTDYRDWLEVGFFPGMRSVSYAASPEAGIILVGPPRLRQLVGDVNCSISEEMKGMPLTCFEDRGSGDQSDWSQPADSPFKFSWASAAETGEGTYSSSSGYSYDGGGFLLNGTGQLVQRTPDVVRPSSELFPFAHVRISAEDLFYSGWMTDRTRVIFHDYALYSANKDAYVSVRLVLEYGPEHGGFVPSKHVRIFFLNKWPDRAVVLEMTFYTVLFMLVARDLKELMQLVGEADQQLKDHIVRLRFELRLRILQHAAFAEIFQYRPRVLMAQISSRLNDPSLDDDRRFHIEQLNKIGSKVPDLHHNYRRYLHCEGRRPPSSTDQALAVIDVLEAIKQLDRHQQEVDALSNSQVWLISKFLIKLRAGLRVYMHNGWRVLDAVNYALFMFTAFARFTLNDLMKTCALEVSALPRMHEDGDTGSIITPWDDDSKFVRFYGIAFWTTNITYAFAFNAVLTWIKIFKYLNYFPNMQILTLTLGVAAKPLAWFCLIIVVVLIGAGQGFFLAFGLDVREYRSFMDSILALLRMAVGDFEYSELEESHRHLGPLMFWMYIFLMFFVLMSVFIALIAESYEEAKEILAEQNDEVKKMSPDIINDQNVRHSIRTKALTRLNDAVECRLLSPPLEHHLAEVTSQWHKVDNTARHSALRRALGLCIPGLSRVSPVETDGASPLELFHVRHKARDDDNVNHNHPLDVFTSDEENDDYDESADLVGGTRDNTRSNDAGISVVGSVKHSGMDTRTEKSSIASQRFDHKQHEMRQLEAEAAAQRAAEIRHELAPLEKRLERIDLKISQDRRSMQQQLDRMQQTNELMYKLLSKGAGIPATGSPQDEAGYAREMRTSQAVPEGATAEDYPGTGVAGAVDDRSSSSLPSHGEIRLAEPVPAEPLRADAFRRTERNSVGHVNHVNDVMAFTQAVLNKRGGANAAVSSTRQF